MRAEFFYSFRLLVYCYFRGFIILIILLTFSESYDQRILDLKIHIDEAWDAQLIEKYVIQLILLSGANMSDSTVYFIGFVFNEFVNITGHFVCCPVLIL